MTRKNSRPPKARKQHRKHGRVSVHASQGRGRTRKDRVKTQIPDIEVMVVTRVEPEARLIANDYVIHARFRAITVNYSADRFLVFIERRGMALKAIDELEWGSKIILREVSMIRDVNEEGESYLSAKGYDLL